MKESPHDREQKFRSYFDEIGYEKVRLVSDKGRHAIYEGVLKNEPVIIKIGLQKKENCGEVSGVKVQYYTQCLLRNMHLESSGVASPEGVIHYKDGYCILEMQKIQGVMCAEAIPDAMNGDFSSKDINALTCFLARLRSVTFDQLDPYLQSVSRDIWNRDFYQERFQQNAAFPLSCNMISQNEFISMKNCFHQDLSFSFQHHDVVPFNILRKADNSLVLLDGEFGRWGMQGYDEGYFVLQTACLLGRPKTALHFLRAARCAWQEEGRDLFSCMVPAFAYRLIAQFNDDACRCFPEVCERTQQVARAFLQKGMAGVEDVLTSYVDSVE